VPAALALSLGLRLARRAQPGVRQAVAVGLAAALLPWLNARYALLSAVVVAHALWQHANRRMALSVLGPCIVSASAILLYHHTLYGFWNPGRVYGRKPEFALSTLPEGLPGLLLDQEFGLLVYAPVLALTLPGVLFLFRRDRRAALAFGAAAVAVIATAGAWHMWRGGFNPPGRFLVPIAPLLLVAVALVWQKRGLTAGAALLVGWSLFTGLAGARDPVLVHRDRDGTAPLFRELSGAREWTGLLPAYVLADPDRHRLAAVWALALLAALPWRGRTPTATRLAASCLGLALAAQAAALFSQQRTGDRDAVRLVGHVAVNTPELSLSRASARWSPEALGSPPLYEPHRHPAGAEVGRRLRLAPGSYRLSVEAERLAGEPPVVVVAPDEPGAPLRESPSEPRADGWDAGFVVRPGERAVSVLLRGGGPALLRGFSLAVQPPGAGTGPIR
jgi:hypothetical protein